MISNLAHVTLNVAKLHVFSLSPESLWQNISDLQGQVRVRWTCLLPSLFLKTPDVLAMTGKTIIAFFGRLKNTSWNTWMLVYSHCLTPHTQTMFTSPIFFVLFRPKLSTRVLNIKFDDVTLISKHYNITSPVIGEPKLSINATIHSRTALHGGGWICSLCTVCCKTVGHFTVKTSKKKILTSAYLLSYVTADRYVP